MRKRINLNLNQLTLPFGERRGVSLSYDHRAKIFLVLTTLSILSLFFYMYAVSATARNIATRQGLEREITKISTSLDSLEFAYIALRNKVTMELAYAHGFQEVKNPLYVSRSSPASLSFNTLNQ